MDIILTLQSSTYVTKGMAAAVKALVAGHVAAAYVELSMDIDKFQVQEALLHMSWAVTIAVETMEEWEW